MTRRSPSRNTRSPRLRKISSIVSPAAASISLIRIEERQTEPGRQAAADLGLAGAHQADQDDRPARHETGGRAAVPVRGLVSRSNARLCFRHRSSARRRSEGTSISCGRVVNRRPEIGAATQRIGRAARWAHGEASLAVWSFSCRRPLASLGGMAFLAFWQPAGALRAGRKGAPRCALPEVTTRRVRGTRLPAPRPKSRRSRR